MMVMFWAHRGMSWGSAGGVTKYCVTPLLAEREGI